MLTSQSAPLDSEGVRYTELGANFILDRSFRVAAGAVHTGFFLGMGIENETIDRAERVQLGLWCGIPSTGIGNVGATHRSPRAADCAVVLCLQGCSTDGRCGPAWREATSPLLRPYEAIPQKALEDEPPAR